MGQAGTSAWADDVIVVNTSRMLPVVAAVCVSVLVGCGGDASDTPAASTPLPAPTLSLQASVDAVPLSDHFELVWSSTDATECTASGAWSGARTTAGLQIHSVSGAGEHVYTLLCSGEGGTVSESVSVTGLVPPTLVFEVSDGLVLRGDSVTLSWVAHDADACEASGAADWAGPTATEGSASLTAALSAQRYRLHCTGPGGEVESALDVATVLPPTLTLSATPAAGDIPLVIDLNWAAENVTGCVATGDWSGERGATGSEQMTLTEAGVHDFDLACAALLPALAVTRTVSVTATDPLAQARALFERRQALRAAAGLGDD